MKTDLAHDAETRHKSQSDEDGGDHEEDDGNDQHLGATVVHGEDINNHRAAQDDCTLADPWRGIWGDVIQTNS